MALYKENLGRRAKDDVKMLHALAHARRKASRLERIQNAQAMPLKYAQIQPGEVIVHSNGSISLK